MTDPTPGEDHWTCGGCGHEGNGPDNVEWYEHTKVCPDLHPTPGEVGLSEAERKIVAEGYRGPWDRIVPERLFAAVERILAARTADLRATVERVRETERRAAWDWFLESLEAHMLKGQPVWDEAVAHRRELLSRAALTTPPTT